MIEIVGIDMGLTTSADAVWFVRECLLTPQSDMVSLRAEPKHNYFSWADSHLQQMSICLSMNCS